MAKVSQIEEIASLVRSGMRIGLGGFWFVRTPMALADAVLASGAADLEIVTFGGGLALERLIDSGRVRRLYFCFNSMDVMGSAPAFRREIERGALEAVELTVLIMSKALQATHENVPFLPIRGPLGSAFIDGAFPLSPLRSPVSNDDLYAVPALALDLSIIHATRADTSGNVEIVGARGLDRRILAAADTRVVSVEEIGGDFAGPLDAHRTTVARFLVDHVVEAPGGARPSSCLPFYATDFRRVREVLGGPAPVLTGEAAPGSTPRDVITQSELMVHLMARLLRDDGIYTIGSVTPMSTVAYQLAKRTHAPGLALIPFAGLVDVGLFSVGISTAETNALATAHGFWGMDDLYEWTYQKGRIDAEIFSPAEIDARARVNNSQVFRPDGTLVRLPGQAGIADVAFLHRNLIMYVPRHTVQRFVPEVSYRGGERVLSRPDDRARANLDEGRVIVVTNLCQLEYDYEVGQFRIISIHPGVTIGEVERNTGFPLLRETEIPISPTPDAATLDLIRNVIDPHALRELEFTRSADRLPAIDRILDSELN